LNISLNSAAHIRYTLKFHTMKSFGTESGNITQ